MTVHSVGGYAEFPPPPDLADAIEALWIHETSGLRHVVHRVVPDAAVSLCYMGSRASDGSSGDARLHLIGPVTQARPFTPRPGHRMESVRIKLEWSLPLLSVGPWEYADRDPLYADARPDLAAPLEARLRETTKPAHALALLVEFVRARRTRVAGAGPLLVVGMESLRRGAGAPRVAELGQAVRRSDRVADRRSIDRCSIDRRSIVRRLTDRRLTDRRPIFLTAASPTARPPLYRPPPRRHPRSAVPPNDRARIPSPPVCPRRRGIAR